MWLVVGLGNKGSIYDGTRHNVGFIAVKRLAEECGAKAWHAEKKFDAHVANGTVAGNEVLFAMPDTYMNLSGRAVQAMAHFYKIPHPHIVVLHDDLDFLVGAAKAQYDRSSAGHNGVEHIIEQLGTQALHRIRIGVGPRVGDGADFVLSKFSADEQPALEGALDSATQLVKDIILKHP